MNKIVSICLSLLIVFLLLPINIAADTYVAKIGDTGYTTLNEFATALTNATAEDTTVKLTDNITVPETITVSSTFTLDLNGKPMSYGGGSGVLVKIDTGASLTITDSSTNNPFAAGGLTNSKNSIIENHGSLTLENGIYYGGRSNTNGGGVYNCGTLIMNNGIFMDCLSNYGGGAIYNNEGSLTINGGLIAYCKSGTGGGIYDNGGSKFEINNLTITQCSAPFNENSTGGAIYHYRTSGFLNNVTIDSCDAKKFGGGVYNDGVLTITNSKITNCKVTLGTDPGDGDVSYCAGGGVYNCGNMMTVNQRLTLINTEISGCSAQFGGGICNVNDGSNIGAITINGTSNIHDNLARDEGGGIFNEGELLVLDSSTIKNNSSKGFGGGVYNKNNSNKLSVGNSAYISLNKQLVTETTPERNSDLYTTGYITIASGDNAPTPNMLVGIMLPNPGFGRFTANADNSHRKNFVSNNESYRVKYNDGTYLELVDQKCSVTFDANGHGIAPEAIENIDYNSTISKPDDLTASGYIFNGWYKEANCLNKWDFDNDKVDDDITLYAKWTSAPRPHYEVPNTGVKGYFE